MSELKLKSKLDFIKSKSQIKVKIVFAKKSEFCILDPNLSLNPDQ